MNKLLDEDQIELLDEDQIAKMLHANKRYVQDLRRAQKLHPAKFGKHWLYRKEEVEEYVNRTFDLQYKK